jgi:hypothetical protein
VELWEQALGTCIAILVGRVLLAWFPPGRIGSHSPPDLALTAATSYLLGFAALDVLIGAATLGTAPPGEDYGRLGLVAVLVLSLVWVALLVLRLATLPGSMVPRHGVPHDRAGWATNAVRLALVVAVVATGQEGTFVVQLVASWIVLDDGLRCARRAPLGRSLALVASGLGSYYLYYAVGTPELWAPESWGPGVLLVGAGAAFTVRWLRVADRRALWLAAVCFGTPGAPGAKVLGPLGLLALVVLSAKPARAEALRAAALGLLLLPLRRDSAVPFTEGWALESTPLLLTLVPVAALLLGLLLAPREHAARTASPARVP